MHRRSFFMFALGALSHLGFGCAAGRKMVQCSSKSATEFIAALTHVADCIYPCAPHAPGAFALGIDRYLERQMYTKYYRRYVPLLERMVVKLDTRAHRDAGAPFASVSPDERRRLTDMLARGELSGGSFDGVMAFNVMTTITLEGCFADPRHGGNNDRMAWDSMSPALDMRWFDDCDCH